MELLWLKVPQWQKNGGPLHGFLGRRGGKSAGPYQSLNLSLRVGDDPETVTENICDVKKAVGVHGSRIVTMRQLHGDGIIEVKDKDIKEAGEADGMIAAQPGIALGILTADCVPVLLSAPGQRLAAVVHAGWRGTLAGLVMKMVDRLRERFGVEPASIQAALGPAIGPCCYEIGKDVSKPLIEKYGGLAQKSLKRRGEREFLDLRDLNRSLLEKAGLPPDQIFKIGPCTSCAIEDFFSYRKEGGETGRQLSFVGWM